MQRSNIEFLHADDLLLFENFKEVKRKMLKEQKSTLITKQSQKRVIYL